MTADPPPARPPTLAGSPLTRNGYALMASVVITSGLGFLFWIAAARLYAPESVGLAGALISSLMTIGSISLLNLDNVLNRFLPVAGGRARTMIARAYGAAAAAAAIFAMAYVAGIGGKVAGLQVVTEHRGMALWFVLSAMLWALFSLEDSVLAGLRQAHWVPLANAAYAASKFALLALLAMTGFSANGLFLAWTLPVPAILVATSLLIFLRLAPRRGPDAPSAAPLTAALLARFVGWDYLGNIALMAAIGLSPLLVLAHAGPAATAGYHLAWTVAYAIFLAGRSMSTSLLAECAGRPNEIDDLAADAVVQSVIPVAIAAAGAIVLAPWIMALFGAAYAGEGVVLLRLLALASIPWTAIAMALAAARARNQFEKIAVIQVATLLLVLAIGFLLVGRWGATGVAVAWLAAHCTVAAGIAAVGLARGWPRSAVDARRRLGAALGRYGTMLARLAGSLRPAERRHDGG